MKTLTQDSVFSQVSVLEDEYWADVDNQYHQYRAEIEENSIAARERKIRRESLAEGMVKGEFKGKTDMARNLKSHGIALETIAQASGLTLSQIQAL